jgi:uncharacterized protein (DUF4415 family)
MKNKYFLDNIVNKCYYINYKSNKTKRKDMALPRIVKVNPITASVMLSATTIQIPVTIISSAKKYLAVAKDFVLNSIPAAQLFLFAAIAYYVFHSNTTSYEEVVKGIKNGNHNSLKDAMRHDKNAQDVLNQVNEEGLNLPQANAASGDFAALKTIVQGLHNGMVDTTVDIITHPLANIADASLHSTGADKLPGVEDRTIYKGLTAEQINQQVSVEGAHEGKTVAHLAASTFQNKKDLKVINEMQKRGANPSIEDKNGKTTMDLAFENNKKEVSDKDVVEVFTNHGEHFSTTMNRAIDQDKTVQVDAHFKNAESKNWTIFGLNIGPNNAEKLLTQADKDGTQPLTHAITKGNLPVIDRLQDNKVFAKNEQAVEVSKLVDAKPTEENIKLEIELLKNTNDKETVEAVKAAVTNPELTTLCDQREEAISSVYNADFLTQVANQAVAPYLPNDLKKGSLGELSNFVQNPTAPTAQKVTAVLTSLPNAPDMVNKAIIDTAMSTTSKVIGWAGDFLAAVGEELGKTLAQESDFSANTSTDYAASTTSTYTPAINPYSSWMIQDVAVSLAIGSNSTSHLLQLTGTEKSDFSEEQFYFDCANLD